MRCFTIAANNFITYHYLYNSQNIDDFNLRLLPVNYLPNTENKLLIYSDYANRARELKLTNSTDDTIAAECYFKDRYDHFYKKHLKKEYWGNYGIYTTPIDLTKFNKQPTNIIYRVNIDLNTIDITKSIIQVSGSNIKKLSLKSYNDIMNNFKDYNHIEDLYYKHKNRVYRGIPQIIIFNDSIEFTYNNIQKINKI